MKRCSLSDPFDDNGVDKLWQLMGVSFDMGYSGSKFTLNGNKYKPSLFWSLGVEGNTPVGCFSGNPANVHEFRGTVSIGLAEIIAMFGGMREMTHAYSFLTDGLSAADFDIFYFNDVYAQLTADKGSDVPLFLLRNGEVKPLHDHVRTIAGLLFVSSYVSPDIFAKLLLYTAKRYTLRLIDMINGDMDDSPKFHAMKFSVRTPDSITESYNITDGRGISILMAYCVIRDMLNACATRGLVFHERSRFDEFYKNCLGSDEMARTHDVSSQEFGEFASYAKVITNEFWHTFYNDGSDREKLYHRCLYESCGLTAWLHNEGKMSVYKLNAGEDEFYYTDAVIYSSHQRLWDVLGSVHMLAVCNTKIKDMQPRKDSASEDELVSLRNEIRTLQARNEELTNELSASKAQAMSDVNALNYQIELKRQYAERLQLKLDTIENEIQGYYGDNSFDDLPDEVQTLDIESMVTVLNQYKLAIIGGMDNKEQQLESYGLNNFVRVSEIGDLRGTPIQADFAVICTRFVAHKLTYQAHKQINVPEDMFMYFNGVNIEKFIAICYDFIMTKLGGYDE